MARREPAAQGEVPARPRLAPAMAQRKAAAQAEARAVPPLAPAWPWPAPVRPRLAPARPRLAPVRPRLAPALAQRKAAAQGEARAVLPLAPVRPRRKTAAQAEAPVRPRLAPANAPQHAKTSQTSSASAIRPLWRETHHFPDIPARDRAAIGMISEMGWPRKPAGAYPGRSGPRNLGPRRAAGSRRPDR
jgi:hypothetical protein